MGKKDKKVYGKFQPQCKLCKMGRDHPAMLKKVYDWRFDENIGLEPLCGYINGELESRGLLIEDKEERDKKEGYLAVNIANLSKHFNEHTSMAMSLEYKKQSLKRIPLVTGYDKQVNPETARRARNLHRERMDLFNELRNLFEDFKRKYDHYDYENDGMIDEGNMNLYLALGEVLRKCLVELAKMKQQERVVNAVVDFIIQKYIDSSINSYITVLGDMKVELVKHLSDEDLAEEMVKRMQDKLSKSLETGSMEVVTDTRQTFGLH